MVPVIEHSCPHSTESHLLLTCQMSTLASDAPFMQTMTVCAALCRLSGKMICKATLPHRQFNS